MFTNEEKQKLKEISNLFDRAEDILLSMSEETQDKIFNFHTYSHSLDHCIRWGLDGSKELLSETQ